MKFKVGDYVQETWQSARARRMPNHPETMPLRGAVRYTFPDHPRGLMYGVECGGIWLAAEDELESWNPPHRGNS